MDYHFFAFCGIAFRGIERIGIVLFTASLFAASSYGRHIHCIVLVKPK
jgi:hypothetical protein